MKAAVRTTYGPPEVVRVTEVPTPEPGRGEVLVRVQATTVNRTDRGYRAGKPFIIRFFSGLIRPKVQVLGTEFAGTVEAVGDRVTSFVPGDRVFGYNERTFGAHAQYMTIPEDGSVATIPAGLTFEQAAPSLEGSHYALAGLRAAKSAPAATSSSTGRPARSDQRRCSWRSALEQPSPRCVAASTQPWWRAWGPTA
jgi:NADPH:quinone reductase-like Zn-dependent oxidoreductase